MCHYASEDAELVTAVALLGAGWGGHRGVPLDAAVTWLIRPSEEGGDEAAGVAEH